MPEDTFRGAVVVFCRVVQIGLVAFAIMPFVGVALGGGTVLALLIACVVAVTLLAFAAVVQGVVWWVEKGGPKADAAA